MNTTSRRTGLLTLLVTSLGSFMVLLDGSIIFVALHEIQKDLGGELSQLQWTVDAYTLPFAALMLTAGTLGDRLGRKKVFLTGLVLFVLGSVLCGFAPSVGLLILGRVVQGLGAAAISTGSLSLLVSTFTDPPGRAKAIGIWTAVSGVSIALGPLLGGILIESFNWQAIFLLNVPIGIIALLLGVPRLIDSRNPAARNVDLPGQVLAAAGLFCLVLGLIEAGREGWGSPQILALLVGAVVLLGGFLAVELRSQEPLLPLELFRNRTFATACLIASLLGFVIVGVMFFMAQYFQAVQQHDALSTGLRLLPLTLGIFFLSPPASRIAGKAGPRIPIMVGAVLATVGFLLLSTIEPTSGFGSVWWKLGLVGIGIGCMFAPLTLAVMASTPPQRAGLGSSMINTTRITGFTAGAAVLGTIVVSQTAGPLAGGPAAAQQALVDAFHTVFYICAGCTILAFVVAATTMVRGRLPGPGQAPGRVVAAPGDSQAAVSPQG
ncbi:MFS transporter [Kribbella sp. NBC_01245]|uniref:MFS transporter n=1 Tax=Kribbella sp. NBC_01245 TaxID=2903578 RepID=UPI002E29D7C2|nr:MFS transporter [Kribbella sp. NBC_01245]